MSLKIAHKKKQEPVSEDLVKRFAAKVAAWSEKDAARVREIKNLKTKIK